MHQQITSRRHRLLDFITVAIFLIAPAIIGLSGFAAILSYVLAAVHLLMTLLTDFHGDRPLPLPLHGAIEALVGGSLLLLSWFVFVGAAQTFYLIMGIVIVLVWILSDY